VNAAEPASAYHLIKTIKVGGNGGWDYLSLDAAARRLYISRGTHVVVLDVDKGKVVGKVADTPGVHGIALVPKLNRGFSSNGRESTVTAFDLKTLRETSRIKVGKGPDAIIYDPATGRVFTFNGQGKDATAIDAAKEKVVGSIELGGKPEFAVADGKGEVYVNLEDKDKVLALNARKLTVDHVWSIAPGKAPSGLAMDRANRRLFVTCHNQKMVILDADSGKVVATPPIGRGTDACTFDAEAGLAFSSNGDGTLSVVQEKSPDKFTALAPVSTQAGARTMALDTKTHNIFLVTATPKPVPEGENPRRFRRSFEPDSFVVLVVGKE
jgi:DNA-binding beta-propeller fold protein YncE